MGGGNGQVGGSRTCDCNDNDEITFTAMAIPRDPFSVGDIYRQGGYKKRAKREPTTYTYEVSQVCVCVCVVGSIGNYAHSFRCACIGICILFCVRIVCCRRDDGDSLFRTV